jgi:hypothetical protein
MIDEFKEQLVEMLQADPYFADIPVMNERKMELDSEIERAVAKAKGLAVLVASAMAERGRKMVRGPYWENIRFAARVFENPTVNATGKSGLAVAEHIAAVWDLRLVDGASEPLFVDSISLGTDPKFVTYDVIGRTMGGLHYEITAIGATTITNSPPGTITLACATAGAAIFYTVDGTTPAPKNGTLYTAPFALGSGVRLRARAFLAGYLSGRGAETTT